MVLTRKLGSFFFLSFLFFSPSYFAVLVGVQIHSSLAEPLTISSAKKDKEMLSKKQKKKEKKLKQQPTKKKSPRPRLFIYFVSIIVRRIFINRKFVWHISSVFMNVYWTKGIQKCFCFVSGRFTWCVTKKHGSVLPWRKSVSRTWCWGTR